jgi:cytochrome b
MTMTATTTVLPEGGTRATTAAPVARVRVWDLPVRVFHWALVASFGTAYVLSESERWRNVHLMFGYTVLGLIAFRLLWGFVGTHHARFASFLFGPGAALGYLGSLVRGQPQRHLGHNPAGSWAIYAILALGAATGVTGWLTLNELGGEAVEELHEAFANAWLVVVFVHVAGVIVSSLAHRENLAASMVTGYKRAAAGEAAMNRPSRTALGLLAAAAVAAFWIGWMLTGGGAAAGGDAGAAAGETSRETAMSAGRDDDDD